MCRVISIFLIILIFFLSNAAYALTDSEYLSGIEKNLFNTKFTQEGLNKRLERIEKEIYGVKSRTVVSERIKRLEKIYKRPIAVKPVPAIKKSPKKIASNKLIKINNVQKVQDSYPAIDEIEKRVLNRQFSSEDIYKRLDRLEIVLFNRNFNDSLYERTDRIKGVVLGQNQPHGEDNSSNNNDSTQHLDQNSINTILSNIEMQNFNTSYANEPVESRLSRLETKIFNQVSPEDKINDRIERLAAVSNAQPANELYRDMSQIRQYQAVATQLSAVALMLLIIKGLLF